MRSGVRLVGWTLAMVFISADLSRGDEPDDGSFGMTEPVVCREINGYEDYVVLPDAALTADEKLLVYFRPRHYKSRRVDGKFEAHLTQDVKVHRRGAKPVLWSKSKMVDYKVRTAEPPTLIFVRNTISLKPFKPGEYDLEIVLHDEVGQSAPAVRTVPFRVLPPSHSPRGAGDDGNPPARPSGVSAGK